MIDDPERCYRAAVSKDSRFDGWFFVGVTSTKIYCRPSCPALTPRRENMRFHPTAASAQAAGFRACKRCRPDATPGSPEWNRRSDAVGRAMRLIADGVVDSEGVAGLARRLGYSERHVHRLLEAEVGVGPLALARAQRAQTARVLIETTDLSFTTTAFAAGFASIRQFNDTIQEVFASTPTQLRARRKADAVTAPGSFTIRLPYRQPFAAQQILGFLGTRAVSGVEMTAHDCPTYSRSLRLAHGPAVVQLTPNDGYVGCTLQLTDVRDLQTAVHRCRRLLDLDADPVAIQDVLGADALLGPVVRSTPGLRAPGAVDGDELAVRAVLGQQVSVAGARTIAGRLAAALGEPVGFDVDGLSHVFPTADALADASDDLLPMPASRRRTLRTLCAALAAGSIRLDPGADRVEAQAKLLELPGIGPWTAGYIAMRALGDPDVFLGSDLGVRHALTALGSDGTPAAANQTAERWRPWRTYAVFHLWESLS